MRDANLKYEVQQWEDTDPLDEPFDDPVTWIDVLVAVLVAVVLVSGLFWYMTR